jgi:hypothetical protein
MPLPEAGDLDELNVYLERCCGEDQGRALAGRPDKVGAAMLIEQSHLLSLATEPFELAEVTFPTIDGLRCVRVRIESGSVNFIWRTFDWRTAVVARWPADSL